MYFQQQRIKKEDQKGQKLVTNFPKFNLQSSKAQTFRKILRSECSKENEIDAAKFRIM